MSAAAGVRDDGLAVLTGGRADPVVSRLVDAVATAPQLGELSLHERLSVLAQVSAPWSNGPDGAPPRTPVVLAQALGREWPSRIHAGLSERPTDPVAPHQLPHLAEAVLAVLDGRDGRPRDAFVADVVGMLRSGAPR